MEINLIPSKGLDRATGALLVDPQAFEDLRNLRPDMGRVLARGGLIPPAGSVLLDDASDCVTIIPFRAIHGAVAIGYKRSTRVLTVWTTDGYGGNAANVGTWATLASGSELPQVIGTEANEKIFLAHDQEDFSKRAKTVYFDPSLSPGSQVVDLVGDFNGDTTPANIYFRGVKAWSDYLLGWGYGTEDTGQGDRSEILRLSLPNDPVTFDKQHYFAVGIKDSAIVAVGIAGGQPQILKENARYRLDGSGRTNFSVWGPEDLFGALNGRALANWGDLLFYWGETGPRVTDGGNQSVDLSVALDLNFPEPLTLPTGGVAQNVWAAANPLDHTILFAWPDIVDGEVTPVYVLAVRDPTQYRWYYDTIGQLCYCGAALVEALPPVAPPIGYASAVSADDTAQSGTGRSVEIDWTNNSITGGETVEIFRRIGLTGAWALAKSVPAAGTTQTVTLLGEQALDHLYYGLRMTRGGAPTVGYNAVNPDHWTAGTAAGSKADTVTEGTAPSTLAGTWSRLDATRQGITATWVDPETGVGFQIEKSSDNATWALVQTVDATADPRGAQVLLPDADLTMTRYLRVRAIRGALTTGYSNVLTRFIGPTVVPASYDVYQTGTTSVLDFWLLENISGRKLEVSVSADGATAWAVSALGTAAVPMACPSPIALGSLTYYRARYGVVSFGVTDFGPYTAVGNLRLTNTAVPGTPTATAAYSAASGSLSRVTLSFSAPTPVHVSARFQKVGNAPPQLWKFQKTALVTDNTITLTEVRCPETALDAFLTTETADRDRNNQALGANLVAKLHVAKLDLSNNQRKRGSEVLVQCRMVMTGGPLLTFSPVSFGGSPGHPGGSGFGVIENNVIIPESIALELTHQSGVPDPTNARVFMFWTTSPSEFSPYRELHAAVSDANDNANHETICNRTTAGLPASGTTIKFRVWVKWVAGTYSGLYSDITELVYVMGTNDNSPPP